MARRARVTLTGDAKLRANLRRMGSVYSGAALDQDMEFSLEPMRRETESNAVALRNYAGKWPGFPQPRGTPPGGHLDQGVETRRVEASGQRRRVWWLAFTRRARKIAHLVEFGTAPHWQPKRRYMHPGARPRPFFRPAYEGKRAEVLRRFQSRAWGRIAGLAASIGRRK